MLPSPRQIIVTALKERALSAEDFARQHPQYESALHTLMRGDYPDDPAQLHAIAKTLALDAATWAGVLASRLTGLSETQAELSLKGRLWRHLIVHGQSLEDCACAHGLPARVLQLALTTGAISKRLQHSRLFSLLVPEQEQQQGRCAGPRRSPANQALASLFTQALEQRSHLSITSLAQDLGVAPRTLSYLLRGEVPHALNPVIIPGLATKLRLDLPELADRIAISWRTANTNHGTLRHLVVRHCFINGYTLEVLARRTGVTIKRLRNIIGGGRCDAQVLGALRREIPTPAHIWDKAVERQHVQRCAEVGAEIGTAADGVLSLPQLIDKAASAAGCDAYQWGFAHGLSRRIMRGIIICGRIPHRAHVRGLLMGSLGLERNLFDQACQRMVATFRPPLRPIDRVNPIIGIQERLLRLVRVDGQSMTQICSQVSRLRDMRDANGVLVPLARKTLEKLVYFGSRELKAHTLEALRRLLGMTPEDFRRQLEPLREDLPVDDAQELRILAMSRKLPEAYRQAWLDVGKKLLEHASTATT